MLMAEPEVLQSITGDDPRHQSIVDLVIALEKAAWAHLANRPDRLEAAAMILTAGAVLSGSMFGRMLIAGAAGEKDKRRAADACAKNFRSGIGVGKQAALRVGAEKFGGHA
jgi:hypothetical protein